MGSIFENENENEDDDDEATKRMILILHAPSRAGILRQLRIGNHAPA